MKKIIAAAVLFLMFSPVSAICREKKELFDLVEALKIQRQGYTLCAQLTPEQQDFAHQHMQEANSKKVYRFQDKALNIVADLETNRVLVMFEQFKKIGREKVQNIIGDLFMTYGDPTISAHDKVVYWAWGKKSRYTTEQFNKAKEKKEKLDIFASVKFSSEIKIMEDAGTGKKGDAYYIISSAPLLQFFNDE